MSPYTTTVIRSTRPNGPQPLYTTEWGEAYVGDALDLLRRLPDESIDLVLSSPPFALARPKAYGNVDETAYADWFLPFAAEVRRVLKVHGSFALELGWSYQKGLPVRSLYNIVMLLRLCDELGFLLAQEFFWHNPAKLPTPVEWVCKRRIRCKDTVSPLWWLSKTEEPKADWTAVRPPQRTKRRTPRQPVGVPDVGEMPRASGGEQDENPSDTPFVEVVSNVLSIANTDSNNRYLRYCRMFGISAHPARFPLRLPQFFIEGLTEPGDLVLDFMAGANSTGAAAEKLERRWLAFELNQAYLAASAFHFLPQRDAGEASRVYQRLSATPAGSLSLVSHLVAGEGKA